MLPVPRSLEEILDQADDLADVFERYEPKDGDEGQASALVTLRLAVARRADADRALLAAVTAARNDAPSSAASNAFFTSILPLCPPLQTNPCCMGSTD